MQTPTSTLSQSALSSQITTPSQVLSIGATASLAATAGVTQAFASSTPATPSQTTSVLQSLTTVISAWSTPSQSSTITASSSKSRFSTQPNTATAIIVMQSSSGGASLSLTSSPAIASVVIVPPSALATTLSGSPSVSCASWNVPVLIELIGGVTPAAVLSPTVGAIARQWLACYLGVRPSDVAISQVYNATLTYSVDPGAPVNSESGTGSCAQSRALAASPEVGAVLNSYHVASRHAPRRLSAGDGAIVSTNVSLVAQVFACSVSAGGSLVLSSPLSALIAALPSVVATISSGNGSSMAASRQLTSFLSAAASASGITIAAVSATAVAGSPGPSSQGLPPPAAASSSNASGAFPTIPVAVACGVVLAGAFIAAVIFVCMRRSRIAKAAESSEAGAAVVGTNPMYSDGHSAHLRRPNRGSYHDSVSGSRESSRNQGGERRAEKPIMQANPIKRDARSGAANSGEAIEPCTIALSPRSRGTGDRGLGSSAGDAGGFTLTSNPMMGGGALAAAVEAGASGVPLQQSAVTYANRHAIVGGGGAVRGRKASGPPESSDRAGTPLEVRLGASASSASAVSR